jgi:mono/diheme cytochrome c family protein
MAATLLLAVILSWDLISDVTRGSGAQSAPITDSSAVGEPEAAGTATAAVVAEGAGVFTRQCSQCHGRHADWPIAARLQGRTRDELYALLDHLPAINPIMPGFQGTDDERRALAAYLASLPPAAPGAP